MFEARTDLNVGRSNDITVSLDKLINGPDGPAPRQAPPLKTPADTKSPTDKKTLMASSDSDPAKASKPRTYEVKSNETFSSIAREQLGSEAAWREIQKLNKGVDPAKMKPGTLIKLPARKTASEAGSIGKTSA